LLVFGAIFIFAVYPLTVLWPAGWAWHHGRSEYLEMIIALYATLGVFLLMASRDPERHTSLIAFTLWSSIVHGTVMAVQAAANPVHAGHLVGDVPALFIVAGVLGWLCPRAFRLHWGDGASASGRHGT
jgi:hypothetical protein